MRLLRWLIAATLAWPALAAATSSAAWVGFDYSTQGTWIGNYGSDGYEVISNARSIPAYATATPANQTEYTWDNNPGGQARALQRTDGSRFASSWYASPYMTYTVNINDGQVHAVSFYAVDWDYSGVRAARYEVRDTVTGELLDQRSIDHYQNGVWLTWNVSGNVTIKMIDTNYPNAVISGVFFDPPRTPPNLIVNGGFEAGATANNSFQYGASDQTPWTLTGGAGITAGGSGIIANNPSGPPEGRLAAFIQQHGTVAQTFTVGTAGSYAVYFRNVNRAVNNLQQLEVTIDGTTLFAQVLPSDPFPSTWMLAATPAITLSAGSHTIQFAGTSNAYDPAGFFDDVRVVPATAFSNSQLLGNFEEWQVGSQNYQLNPGAQPWTFSNGGVAANGSGLGNPAAPQGAQSAFIYAGGSMQLTWTDAGSSNYGLTFAAAKRGTGANPTVTMIIDGTTAGSWSVTSAAFGTLGVNAPISAGAHTIQFTSSGGDVFIDNIQAGSPIATLIAELHLDEASWNGTAGEAVDSSGSNHPGTATGSPVSGAGLPARSGNPGTCSYAELHGGAFDVTGLPVSNTTGDQTSVSFWFYWDGTNGAMPIGWNLYDLWFSGGQFGFNSANSSDLYGTSSSGMANSWHHIAAVFTNGGVSGNQLYIDGVNMALTQQGSVDPTRAVVTSTLRLGGWAYDSNYRSGSSIDEVRIYNGAMTQAQVNAAMAAGHTCSAGPSPGGFNAFESGTAAGAITGVIHTKVAGNAVSVDVVALDTPRTSVMTSFTGSVKVEILNAVDNSGAFDAGACRSSWVPVASGASVTVTFAGADAGRKTVTFTEPEAWRDLRLRITTPATGTVQTQACSSDDFAMRPASFASLSVSDANSGSAGTTRTLGNTAATGGVVHKAGQPFTLRATAVNGAGTTTANYAGTPAQQLLPCTGTGCGAGWVHVAGESNNFMLTSTRLVRYGADVRFFYQTLGPGWISCSNGTFGDPAFGIGKGCDVASLGTLSMIPSAASGVINAVGSYSEAGAFTLQLIDSSFANVDASDGSSASEINIVSAGLDVGRFVPDHFDVQQLAAPVLKTFDSSSCTARSFTYLGQPFGYTSVAQAQVLARNAAGATTQNYTGSLWKLDSTSLAQSFAATPASPSLDASAATAPAITSNSDGTGLVVGTSTDKLRFTRSTTPLAPFNASIALTWSAQDASEAGVAGNGTITTTTPLVFSNIGFDAGSQMRFGQIRMVPAYGSELVNLPVLVEAQYWDGQRMATNAADQCTAVPTAAVAMSNYQRNLAACKTAVSAGNATLASGRGYLRLARPGTGNSGSVDLALQLGGSAAGQVCSAVNGASAATAAAGLPWLQGRWGNAAAYDQNPSTRASFGQYRSPMIYQRETF